MKNKFKLTFIFVCILILSIFAYMGYFPFNYRFLKHINFYMYDGIHLAFNISNVEFQNKKYYCPKHSKAKRMILFKELDELKLVRNTKEIEKNNLINKKYIIIQKDYDDIEYYQEHSILFGDNRYKRTAEFLQNKLKNKENHNNKINSEIKSIENELNIIDIKISKKYQEILNYCYLIK